MKHLLKEFFSFSKRNRNGMLLLLSTIVILLSFPSFHSFFIAESPPTLPFPDAINDYQAHILVQQEQAHEARQITYQKTNATPPPNSFESNTAPKIEPFPFNPNTLTVEEAQRLGLSKRVAHTIQNYRNKGGKFFKKEDLKKIYGLKQTDYEHLAKYIVIPKSKRPKDDKQPDIPSPNQIHPSTINTNKLFDFNPNTITLADLQQLGLSQKVAKTWVKFRDKGGQFFNTEDVKKIYGLTSQDYLRLADYMQIVKKERVILPMDTTKKAIPFKKVTTKASVITKPISLFPFNPNTITIEKLQQLGLSKKVATTWINFRSKGGQFFQKEEVQKIYGLTTSDYNRLVDYINIPPPEKKQDIEFATKHSPTFKSETVKNKVSPLNTTVPETKKEITPAPKPIQAFPFDPNTISLEELKQLGLSNKVAQTWVNFRSKGGQFFQKEEVKKIYGLTAEVYQQLEDHITIKTISKTNPTTSFKQVIQLDINIANEVEWQKIRGIGEIFSARIVKYRNLLGGFTHKEQLREVYGLDEEKYNNILPALTLSKPIIRQINLHTTTINALKKHPYIEYSVAESIVHLREQHGLFKNVADIKQSYAIDEALFQKIKPYLTVP